MKYENRGTQYDLNPIVMPRKENTNQPSQLETITELNGKISMEDIANPGLTGFIKQAGLKRPYNQPLNFPTGNSNAVAYKVSEENGQTVYFIAQDGVIDIERIEALRQIIPKIMRNSVGKEYHEILDDLDKASINITSIREGLALNVAEPTLTYH